MYNHQFVVVVVVAALADAGNHVVAGVVGIDRMFVVRCTISCMSVDIGGRSSMDQLPKKVFGVFINKLTISYCSKRLHAIVVEVIPYSSCHILVFYFPMNLACPFGVPADIVWLQMKEFVVHDSYKNVHSA